MYEVIAKCNFRQAEEFTKAEWKIARPARKSLFLFPLLEEGPNPRLGPFCSYFSSSKFPPGMFPIRKLFQLTEKLNFLSFRGALRAEESLFHWHLISERFLASLGMTK